MRLRSSSLAATWLSTVAHTVTRRNAISSCEVRTGEQFRVHGTTITIAGYRLRPDPDTVRRLAGFGHCEGGDAARWRLVYQARELRLYPLGRFQQPVRFT